MKFAFCILFSLVFLKAFSQKEKPKNYGLFEKGVALYSLVYNDLEIDQSISELDPSRYEDSIKIKLLTSQKKAILNRALEYYEQFISQTPNSFITFQALQDAGFITYQLKDTNRAINFYEKALNFHKVDQDLKYQSCLHLAQIYLEHKDFKKSLKYLKLTKKYPFRSFCGNAYDDEEIHLSVLYARCYIGLDQIQKALYYTLPKIFYDGLALNKEIVDLAVQILQNNFDQEKILSELEEAVKNPIKDDSGTYYLNYFNVKVPVYYPVFIKNSQDLDIRDSYFYKSLTSK